MYEGPIFYSFLKTLHSTECKFHLKIYTTAKLFGIKVNRMHENERLQALERREILLISVYISFRDSSRPSCY